MHHCLEIVLLSWKYFSRDLVFTSANRNDVVIMLVHFVEDKVALVCIL